MGKSRNNQAVLIYDGDCAFCAYWVRYWRRLTGDRVTYRKYPDVAADYPDIAVEDLGQSMHYIEPGSEYCSGAHAAFQVLNQVEGKHIGLWLYRVIPGFAWFAESSYGFIAAHPIAAARVSRMLWGREHYPTDYRLVAWLFLRLLAILYLAAFASMSVQIEGLVGATGILPITFKLAAIESAVGVDKYWLFPTIFWANSSDWTLRVVCLSGMGASVLVLLNVVTRTGLILCFVLYLSVMYVGQNFMTFQWDTLLLESGFLAIFLTSGSRIAIFLYRWLLARFMFMGGLVKLASGDEAWWNLTALSYHYETQPLPSPLAWYAHQLPEGFQRMCVAGVFFIELVVPFLVFMPRRLRLFAAWSFLLLQTGIMLTGNYNFFNLLSILLCLFLFEDRDIRKLFPKWLATRIQNRAPTPGRVASVTAGVFAGFVFLACGTYIWIDRTGQLPSKPLATLVQLASTFSLVNNYGPFAIMTRQRLEINVEGSNDGRSWKSYGFKYKPDQLNDGLRWIIPHQPRLDWQMWFAVLRPPYRDSWVVRFLDQVKAGSPKVLGLLAHNPFPEKPPDYVRASLYRYTYTTPKVRRKTGKIWRREFIGAFWPPER